MTNTKFPDIKVKLSHTPANALSIIGFVTKALRAKGVGAAERQEFMDDATSKDYDHVLQTAMKWVSVS